MYLKILIASWSLLGYWLSPKERGFLVCCRNCIWVVGLQSLKLLKSFGEDVTGILASLGRLRCISAVYFGESTSNYCLSEIRPSLWCHVSPQRSYSRDCSQHWESLSRFPLLGWLTWRAMEEAAAWPWMDSQPIRARSVGAASPGTWQMLLQHHVWQRNASSVTLKRHSSSSTLLSIGVGKAWLCTNGGSCFSRCWTWLKTALSPKGWACKSWNFSSKIWACQQSSKFVETRDVVEIQMVLPGVW